ncbi:site-specific integrase, partial [Coleofasciculus sp. LEGE 07081]|uniref:site-specific integrase n=1 Tax=Coleofasciculus sp. LEGE 07081 TaxID=2777967 RepID=UPI0018827A05
MTILIKGNRLYLRGTLPPRPMSNKSFPHQQEIALGLDATVDGLHWAEKEARKVGFLLESGDFSWKPYLRHRQVSQLPHKTIGDWISALKTDYFMRRAKTPQSLTTWETNYNEVFKRLPLSQPLTTDLLVSAIAATPPDTRIRQKTCLALDKLAQLAGIEFDAKRFAGNYSPTKVSPRSLPSDEVIVEWYYRLSNPAWQWAYGMLATYGLRPHELFHLDLERFRSSGGVLMVLAGKTGARRVWPLHPEWVEEFGLTDVKLPSCHGKTNRDLGHRVTRYFRRQGMPFRPYDLRHCWAIRSM